MQRWMGFMVKKRGERTMLSLEKLKELDVGKEASCYSCIYIDGNEEDGFYCRYFGMVINDLEPFCSAYTEDKEITEC